MQWSGLWCVQVSRGCKSWCMFLRQIHVVQQYESLDSETLLASYYNGALAIHVVIIRCSSQFQSWGICENKQESVAIVFIFEEKKGASFVANMWILVWGTLGVDMLGIRFPMQW